MPRVGGRQAEDNTASPAQRECTLPRRSVDEGSSCHSRLHATASVPARGTGVPPLFFILRLPRKRERDICIANRVITRMAATQAVAVRHISTECVDDKLASVYEVSYGARGRPQPALRMLAAALNVNSILPVFASTPSNFPFPAPKKTRSPVITTPDFAGAGIWIFHTTLPVRVSVASTLPRRVLTPIHAGPAFNRKPGFSWFCLTPRL